ncbi:UdgX family uracil-DNA binding protein [Oleiharenicola lentus]|uniref:UdgX family uracil-DNA binding protein n=1 Tax=Oleiharenicola lentus TaxID=2508720 RepID=UPI003F67902A
MEQIVFDGTFTGWQNAARSALVREVRPETILWHAANGDQGGLDFNRDLELVAGSAAVVAKPLRVPREFMQIARTVACHRDESRWRLLYRALWRLTHGEPHLFAVTVDPDVIALGEMAKAIGRDLHKMRAFVRFREVSTEDGAWFVAWFEPHHHIVEANAPFFVGRFASMNWSILTPDRCMHWNQQTLTFTPGVTKDHAPDGDITEDLWRTYYGNIFNPARVKIGAMKKEMPKYYWKNLPEAELIPHLLEEAATRVESMTAASRSKAPAPDIYGPAPVPNTDDLEILREAALACRACPLWKEATQTVFGEGPRRAKILVVGEQPGDQEDLAGKPFVGPAGKLWNRALEAAGVDREQIYVTNAVKHFKWEPQGKRRLHKKPTAREVAACRPWLEAELRLIKPELIVCLGSTAAHSVVGPDVRVLSERGNKLGTEFDVPALITVHPSSLLRQPDPEKKEADFAAFVADLKKMKA